MGDILRRRGMMAAASGGPSYWDFEWDYSMGKLEEQSGWTYAKSGTAASSLISDGEKVYANNSGAYFQINPQDDNPILNMPNGYGTLEVTCYGKFYNSTGKGTRNARIFVAGDTASGNSRIQVYAFNGKWRINAAAGDNNPAIADASNNTVYTIRIALKGSAADIYVNNVLCVEDYDLSSLSTGSKSALQVYSAGGSSYYTVWQSLKIHLGPN